LARPAQTLLPPGRRYLVEDEPARVGVAQVREVVRRSAARVPGEGRRDADQHPAAALRDQHRPAGIAVARPAARADGENRLNRGGRNGADCRRTGSQRPRRARFRLSPPGNHRLLAGPCVPAGEQSDGRRRQIPGGDDDADIDRGRIVDAAVAGDGREAGRRDRFAAGQEHRGGSCWRREAVRGGEDGARSDDGARAHREASAGLIDQVHQHHRRVRRGADVSVQDGQPLSTRAADHRAPVCGGGQRRGGRGRCRGGRAGAAAG